jgi:hypothetical protein
LLGGQLGGVVGTQKWELILKTYGSSNQPTYMYAAKYFNVLGVVEATRNGLLQG